MAGPTLTLVHGAPTLNTLYWTEDRSDDFCRKMGERVGALAGDVIAFGHTHEPWHREVDGVRFVNTGSVGRPKDGDWRAGYVVLEFGEGGSAAESARGESIRGETAPAGTVRVEVIRVEYDLDRAREAILESDLPDDFAEYLATGGKPAG